VKTQLQLNKYYYKFKKCFDFRKVDWKEQENLRPRLSRMPHWSWTPRWHRTNFVGAEKELIKIIAEEGSTKRISNFTAQQGINFHFNPPCSPLMGGIWEGVKSMKFHLCRVVGNVKLTFEEFYTLLCQVEAVLNSKPICPLSNKPDNLQVLTPGHFVIGTSLLALPDYILTDLSSNCLSRWLYVQRMAQ
jgi:hypothetical protein